MALACGVCVWMAAVLVAYVAGQMESSPRCLPPRGPPGTR